MLNDTDSGNLKSILEFNAHREHDETMNLLVEKQYYNLFSMLKPKIFMDGNMWCVMIGENPMEGIQGFGETPFKAMLDFNKSWHKSLTI